jgi:type IX secretion system PorP/SprF family membrane protein
MYNQLMVNPAYAGSKNDVSLNIFDKKQWNDYTGAPSIQFLSVHAPFSYQRIGIGLWFLNESVGTQKNFSATAAYSYKINFSKGILSFGLSTGLRSQKIDLSSRNIKDPNDPLLQTTHSRISADFGTGIYYQSSKFYIGISATHLFPTQHFNNSPFTPNMRSHYYFIASRKFTLTDNITIIPSCLLKYVGPAPLQLDLTTHIKYKEALWTGMSYRTSDALSFQAGFALDQIIKAMTEKIKIGYAYDISLGGLSGYNSGTHEIMLIYDFSIHKSSMSIKKQKSTVSPLLF